MADTAWLTPRLDVVTTVVVVGLAILVLVLGPWRAPARYRTLDRDRTAGVPDALAGYFRRALRRQAICTVVVLAAVAVPAGLSTTDVGLRLPHGPHTGETWGWTVYLCALILVAGLVQRRWALTGRTVPGQHLFRALIPATSSERRLGAAVAFGAGVSEELIFRGLFTAAAISLFGLSAVAATVVLCALFGLAHTYQGWLGVVGTALVGAVLAWLYLRSQSLLPPVIVHVVVDLRAFVLVPAQRADAVPRAGRRSAPPVGRTWSAPPAADLQDGIGDDRPVLP